MMSLDPSVKAAKNDDAEVIEQQWDVWSVDNFIPPGPSPAKVCVPGTYNLSTHGKLFNGLQSLAVHWYCQRILKSFLGYLRSHYGRGRTYREVLMVGQTAKNMNISTWVKLKYQFKTLNRPKRKQGNQEHSEFKKDLMVGSEAIWRSTLATWWNLDGGSTIYF